MDYILLLSILVSFLSILIFLPIWIKKCKQTQMLWEDMNKKNHPKNVASSGGVIVILGFILGIFTYLFLKSFITGRSSYETQIFALIGVILLFCVIGLVDDLLGWKKGGLSIKFRIFMAIFASIPLIIINAGIKTITLPFIGPVYLGLIYPFIVLPLAIGFVSTTFNFLAGFNGLEAGMGILMLSFLSFVAYFTGSFWLSIIGLCMVSALIGFLIFNWCPAKVFPGDILTYSIGALLVSIAVLGNFEKFLLIIYIPYFAEVLLKLRGKLKKQSFGKVNKKGYLELPYPKIYSLTHLSILILSKFKKNIREKDVVYFIYSIEILFILIATLFLI